MSAAVRPARWLGRFVPSTAPDGLPWPDLDTLPDLAAAVAACGVPGALGVGTPIHDALAVELAAAREPEPDIDPVEAAE